jgi:hypothetical protein
MSELLLQPDFVTEDRWTASLVDHHVAVLNPVSTLKVLACGPETVSHWAGYWKDLPPDQYLLDGGHYRHRRHSSFVVNGDAVLQVPHRAHWQPVSYNALHGGMTRWFEPMDKAITDSAEWLRALAQLGHGFSKVSGLQPWFVEAHQFRIDTAGGIGRPTPEGAHRDGVDYVVVMMVERHHILGGESRVFEANGRRGERFTLLEPWTMLVLDDREVIHETTPIRPAAEPGYRDTLVLTYRSGGFQDAT